MLSKDFGTFGAAVKYAVRRSAIEVAVADLNGDGKLDLAVANADSNNISVLMGNGDGTFQPAVNYAAGGGAGSSPSTVVVGDFNGDGVGSDNVSVLLGKGDGTFQPDVNYATGSGPNSESQIMTFTTFLHWPQSSPLSSRLNHARPRTGHCRLAPTTER
jgi:hypothetical protein